MPFQPHIDQVLTIERMPYRIAGHPSAPGMVYGQEGRQGIVYQLLGDDGAKKALKVFKPRFRLPGMVALSQRLAPWAALAGLEVCRRTVLTPHEHAELLRQHPDLTYAVLMPWVEGATWMEVLLSKRVLIPAQGLALARALADVLARMEQQEVAHCDLSGPNVLVLPSPQRSGVALVDVEQLYAPDLRRPVALPGGSPGYAHSTAPDGLWAAEADRFAGAVLIAEMLGWCDERVREVAWGESYFDPAEVQADSRRYRVLRAVLAAHWGDAAAGLFERAWRSDTLSDCATFGEWLLALPERVGGVVVAVPAPQGQAHGPEVEQPALAPEAGLLAARELIALGQRLAKGGQRAAALAAYRQAQALAPGTSLAGEVALLIGELEQMDVPLARPEPTPPPVALSKNEDGRLARSLAEAEARSAPARVPGWVAAATGVAAVGIVAVGVCVFLLLWMANARAAATARTEATAATVQANATATARAGAVATAGAQATVMARGEATAAAQAQATAEAETQATALASRSETATAEAQTHATAQAQVSTAVPPRVYTVEVSAREGWQDTGVELNSGDVVGVRYVSGGWSYWPGRYGLHGANGPADRYICAHHMSARTCVEPIPDYPKGALIGRLGQQLFGVGDSLDFTARASGRLELRMNDDALGDNDGAITVRVTVQSPTPVPRE